MQEQVEWFMSQPDDVKKSELAAMRRNNPKWYEAVKAKVVERFNDDKTRNSAHRATISC